MRILALMLAALVFTPAVSLACDIGYSVTSTFPASQATGVPVDTRIFVYFTSTPGFEQPQSGMVLVESATQQGILGSVEVFDGHNPDAEVGNYVAVLEPFITLSPNTEYELVFGEGS